MMHIKTSMLDLLTMVIYQLIATEAVATEAEMSHRIFFGRQNVFEIPGSTCKNGA